MFNDKKVFLYYCTKTIDKLDIEIEDLDMFIPCNSRERAVITELITTRERLIDKVQSIIDRVTDGEIGACEEVEDIIARYTEYRPIKDDFENSIVINKKALETIKEGYEQLMRYLK